MKSKSPNSQPTNTLVSRPSLKGVLAVFFIKLAGKIPLRISQRIGKYLGKLMVMLNTREVKIARRNIELCFPDMSIPQKELFLRKVFEHGGMQLFEIAFLWTSHPKASLRHLRKVQGEEFLDQAMEAPNGLIIILPHLGNWEMLNAYMCEKMEIRAMYTPAQLIEVDRLMSQGRSQTGLKLAPANARGISSLTSTLRSGGNILIFPDQEPGKNSGAFAPFFGIEAYSMTLISKMLSKSGAKTLLAYINRREVGEGFDIIFKSLPDEIYSDDIRISLTALNKAVEDCVKEHPEQYMWGYKRFRKRPEGESKLYNDLI